MYLNATGFFIPIGLLYYVGNSLTIDFGSVGIGGFIGLFCFNWIIFHLSSFTRPKGVLFYSWAIQLVAFIDALVVINVLAPQADVKLQMWWVFLLMFSSSLLVDLYRAIPNLDKFQVPKGGKMSLGGAGAADVLFSAPVSGIIATYILLHFWYQTI